MANPTVRARHRLLAEPFRQPGPVLAPPMPGSAVVVAYSPGHRLDGTAPDGTPLPVSTGLIVSLDHQPDSLAHWDDPDRGAPVLQARHGWHDGNQYLVLAVRRCPDQQAADAFSDDEIAPDDITVALDPDTHGHVLLSMLDHDHLVLMTGHDKAKTVGIVAADPDRNPLVFPLPRRTVARRIEDVLDHLQPRGPAR
jgi:hypothetical protein